MGGQNDGGGEDLLFSELCYCGLLHIDWHDAENFRQEVAIQTGDGGSFVTSRMFDSGLGHNTYIIYHFHVTKFRQIPHVVWNRYVHCRGHNSPSLNLIL